MKLLCVSPSYWPAFQYGGPIPAVHGLNKALVKKGIDVSVYTTNVGLKGKVPVNQEISVEGVKVRYFKFVRFLEFLGDTGWQFSLQMRRALRRHLKEFDIVHIPAIWNFPTAIASYYCKKFEKPYIISPHGALQPCTISKKVWKKRPYYFLITKRNLNDARAICYLTDFEMKSCHQALGLKNIPFVVPNGIDLAPFNDLPNKEALGVRYPLLNNKTVILFLGRIHWIKGLDILSKAFGNIARERKNVHLLMVGNNEGGVESKVRQWLQEAGVEKEVTFTGILKGEDKLRAFAGSDIFVLPSYSEGFSMAILEAMACRVPVIITRQCNFPEVDRYKGGFIIDPDEKQLTRSLLELLDFPEARRQMGENGWRLVREKFTWDKIAEQIIEMYESLL